MEVDQVTAAKNVPRDGVFDIGTWVGQHQALAWMASGCSAADALALKTIHDRKLYRPLNLNWHEFCARYLGRDHKTADTIIARLEEFGETYFHLSKIVKLPEAEYRALQASIEDNTIEFDGRRIPIDREHAEELAGMVAALRQQLKQDMPEQRAGKPRKKSPADDLQARIDQLYYQLLDASARVNGETERVQASLTIEGLIGRLRVLARTLEPRR